MKALILNSGTGSRMKGLTTCKCLVELEKGITIFDTQIQSVLRCGIKDIVITTGAFANELDNYARKQYPQARFTFVNNPLYDKTNYIYSMYLARHFINDSDIVLLHGDLVYEQNVLQDIIAFGKSCMVTDSTKPLPEKDFKAAVINGTIKKIGVDIFECDGGKCFYAQPMYKLFQKDFSLWLEAINLFCEKGETDVYAENALNHISHTVDIYPLDIKGRICFEVDNREDLTHAQGAYSKMPDRLQTVFVGQDSFSDIKPVLQHANVKKPFIVCGNRSVATIEKELSALNVSAVYFNGYTPNPDLSQIAAGIKLFEKENCDFIVSLGGGSAIDTAKGINISAAGKNTDLLEVPRANHLAIPTTAGTGSESTSFAVLYDNGEKISLEHKKILPQYVILDSLLLKTLPLYHKKSALLDALCQSIESLWAKAKTPQSQAYALSAMHSIKENALAYLNNCEHAALRILNAANLSGKAINISKTTAAHAMSYKLSNMYNIAHGHAVALCLHLVWKHLIENNATPDTLTISDYEYFKYLLSHIDLGDSPEIYSKADELANFVNFQRLENHPVSLSHMELADMYRQII